MRTLFGARPRALIITIATACAAAAVLVPAQAAPPASSRAQTAVSTAAAQAPGELTSRVRGTFAGGVVRGTFQPKRFVVRNGDAYGVGILRATLRQTDGDVIGTVTRQITVPVRNATNPAGTARAMATCDILHLVLGPLDLDLLGLQVHLNRVVLDIVAATGAGNLLGNLLCAVTGLLDNTGLLGQLRLSNLLNRILSILRL